MPEKEKPNKIVCGLVKPEWAEEARLKGVKTHWVTEPPEYCMRGKEDDEGCTCCSQCCPDCGG